MMYDELSKLSKPEIAAFFGAAMHALAKNGVFAAPSVVTVSSPVKTLSIEKRISTLCSDYVFTAPDQWTQRAQKRMADIANRPALLDADNESASDSIISLVKLSAHDPAVVKFFNAYIKIAASAPSAFSFQELLDAQGPTLGDRIIRSPEQAQARQTNVQAAISAIREKWPDLSGKKRPNWSGWTPGSPSPE